MGPEEPPPVAQELHRLHQDDHQHHGDGRDRPVELLVAVGDREVAEAATADRTRDGRHVHHRDEHEGVAEDQRPQGLRHQQRGDDAERTRPHRAGRLDHAGIDRDQVLLHDAGDTERGGDDEGERRGGRAELSAHDLDGERADRRDEDDERDGPDDVHRDVEHRVHDAVRPQPTGTRGVEEDAEQQPQDPAHHEGGAHHPEGFADGVDQHGAERVPVGVHSFTSCTSVTSRSSVISASTPASSPISSSVRPPNDWPPNSLMPP